MTTDTQEVIAQAAVLLRKEIGNAPVTASAMASSIATLAAGMLVAHAVRDLAQFIEESSDDARGAG